MRKRKFTQRQTREFQQRQHAQAQRVSADSQDEQYGLVVSRFGRHADVEDAHGNSRRCHIRATLESVVTGDRVIWQPGVITAILPRSSALTRADARGISRVLAANIAQMLIVIAPLPPAHATLIHRYIVAAHASNITPIILLNKMDLLDHDPDEKNRLLQLLDMYRTMGYHTFMTSSKTDTALTQLREQLRDKTNIFVGQSGVGKSSLINSLLPEADTLVGDLSLGTDKGTHTTTAARLFHLPHGGSIIDSPGIREYHLSHLNKTELMAHFIDIAPFANQCKFRNCQHDQEPDCAVQQALRDGKIAPQRLDSYYRILHTLT